MADNIQVTPGTGATVAADDIGGALFQRVKTVWGPDGTGNDVDVASGKSLPIQLRGSDGSDGGAVGVKTDAASTATDATPASVVAVLKEISRCLQAISGSVDYETVAAAQTNQVLGTSGATGDFLSGLLLVPASTAPGAVSIRDGNGSAITVFVGGDGSVSNLVPFFVAIGANSIAGPWKVTTGSNISAIGMGNFT